MTLTPKNCIYNNNLDFCLHKYHRIIATFSLAMMHLCFLLPIFAQVAVGESPSSANCSDVKLPGISHLVSSSQQVSTWLLEPRIGISDIIEAFIPQSFIKIIRFLTSVAPH